MKLIGNELKNIPWEEKPKDCKGPIWRYSENPIIKRDATCDSNSIFNSAVVAFKDGFAGVFRVDRQDRTMKVNKGFSKDGINWNIDDAEISFLKKDNHLFFSDYKYDPRVVFLDDRYYITWCNGYHGPTIGLGYTKDFKDFYQLENALLPYNRNGVLFPKKINDKYYLLSRPSDTGHTPFGDIFISESKDLVYWGKHRHVMSPALFEDSAWQCMKIGAGPVPIETDKGWLLFYHGVLRSCSGYNYSFGVALLDKNEPWKVIARSKKYLLSPQKDYEIAGDVPNVVFPCAALTCSKTGKIAIYYGCADTTTSLCFTTVDEISNWLLNDKENNLIK